MIMQLLRSFEGRRRIRRIGKRRLTPTVAKVYKTEKGYFVNLVARPRKRKGKALKVIRIRI